MTNREFFTNVINGNITEDVITHATEAVAKLDKALENRKNKPSKKALENAPILEALTAALTVDPQISADLAVAVGVSTPKASALLRQLVAEGVAVQSEVKGPKGTTVKAYALTPVDTADVE